MRALRFLFLALTASFAMAEAPKGTLMIHGGGRMGNDFLERFVKEVGDPNALVLVVPTSQEGEIDPARAIPGWLRRAGFRNLKVLHTRDRKVADTDAFVAPIREAKGVWLSGGRQWRATDVYLGTKTQKELQALYQRGGVITGSSAGATLQGSFLVRGSPKGNHIMMAEGRIKGLGFLPDTAVDQHLIKRKREKDLLPVIRKHPKILGIGIDEDTAIVVQKGAFEVLGRSQVLTYQWDGKTVQVERHDPGERFDLAARRALVTP